MANIKKKLKWFGRYVWEIVKASLPAFFMYLCAGLIMFMLIFKAEEDSTKFKIAWETSTKIWSIVCILFAVAYNALICWAHGGSHYEQLVSGNVKRSTEDAYGNAYKISSHREAKEYRVWKGFTFGIITAILTLITGIVFGSMQAKIDADGVNAGAMVCTLLSGWSILPFYAMNAAGASFPYFATIAFAAVPIVMSGGFYIIGAYARRNKAIRQQQIAEEAAKSQTAKEKKINYGGLPGTKPKKRK